MIVVLVRSKVDSGIEFPLLRILKYFRVQFLSCGRRENRAYDGLSYFASANTTSALDKKVNKSKKVRRGTAVR